MLVCVFVCCVFALRACFELCYDCLSSSRSVAVCPIEIHIWARQILWRLQGGGDGLVIVACERVFVCLDSCGGATSNSDTQT